MRSLYLTLLIFVQVLLASFIFYSSISSASPILEQHQHVAQAPVTHDKKTLPDRQHAVENKQAPPSVVSINQDHYNSKKIEARSNLAPVKSTQPNVEQQPNVVKAAGGEHPLAFPKPSSPLLEKDSPVIINSNNKESPIERRSSMLKSDHHRKVVEQVVKPKEVPEIRASEPVAPVAKIATEEQIKKVEQMHHYEPLPEMKAFFPESFSIFNVKEDDKTIRKAPELQAPVETKSVGEQAAKVVSSSVGKLEHSVPLQSAPQKAPSSTVEPLVKGGLGPLHLLAATLCRYQPDKPVADENQNLLYARRAAVRKALFEFMSLKFTNLEKFSSRLNAGLEVVPPKVSDPSQVGPVPSHGWPVVGKCTAHDLKLMAEAAWCECVEESTCGKQQPSGTEALDKQEPAITSNHHNARAGAARSIDESSSPQISADKSAIISKILHVSDVKDAPVVESTIASLNLTQQQLASLQAQATSTRECRRNALKMTKTLFNHLAEDQRLESESWPKLYAQMAGDECARKRMIDIVSALSGYRSESSSIRRDNVEFAFAMDDLRVKVLESEVNVPLTFDKQFIEVGQFLQQSVKLMLANIDPEKAKLTSMRYRSLMLGPGSADDQCIELHQRLLAKNYPSDCNPTQFGQLPDVLRMAASSLELWSIESELNKYSAKSSSLDYPAACSYQQHVKQDLNECIANLVSY